MFSVFLQQQSGNKNATARYRPQVFSRSTPPNCGVSQPLPTTPTLPLHIELGWSSRVLFVFVLSCFALLQSPIVVDRLGFSFSFFRSWSGHTTACPVLYLDRGPSLHLSLAQQHSFNNCCSTRLWPPEKEFDYLAVLWLTLRRCPRTGPRPSRRGLFSFCLHLA